MTENKWWQTKRAKQAFIAGGVVSAMGFLIWFFAFRPYVSTDDARVAAVMIRVAPDRQSGRITAVYVKEGDHVKKGDLLLELNHDLAEAGLLRAKAKLAYASRELDRYTRGLAMQVAQQHDVDQMRMEVDVARAEVKIAEANLDDTFQKSPCDGVVVQKLADPGNLLEPHQTALVIASVDGAWISANIEETSVKNIKTGQPVRIHVDEGYDLEGSVGEVIRAAASQFALIPSDNASGNFTKVVQRIPIKVLISPGQNGNLRVGQSVEIKIKVH